MSEIQQPTPIVSPTIAKPGTHTPPPKPSK